MSFSFDERGFMRGGKKVESESKSKDSHTSNTENQKAITVNNIRNSRSSQTSNNTTNYEVPDEATSAVIGGDIGNAIKELGGLLATPFNFIKDKFQAKKKENREKRKVKTLDGIYKESEKATDALDRISKNSGIRGKDKKPRKIRGSVKVGGGKGAKGGNGGKTYVDKNGRRRDERGRFVANSKAKVKKGLGVGKVVAVKTFVKGMGVLGLVVGAVSGMREYKKIVGLSANDPTTFSQKVVAGIGGIVGGISDTIEFFSGGQIKLINKETMYKKLEQIRKLAVKNIDELLADHPQLKAIVNGIGTNLNRVADMAGTFLNEIYTSLTTGEIAMPQTKENLAKVWAKLGIVGKRAWNYISNLSESLGLEEITMPQVKEGLDKAWTKLKAVGIITLGYISRISESLGFGEIEPPQVKEGLLVLWGKVKAVGVIALGYISKVSESLGYGEITVPQFKEGLDKVWTNLKSVGKRAWDYVSNLSESLGIQKIEIPKLSELVEKMEIDIKDIYKSVLDFKDIVEQRFMNMVNSAKRAVGIKTKSEKNFDSASEKRGDIESEIKKGRGVFESWNKYQKRLGVLNQALVKAKQEELTQAKLALEDKEFSTNSGLRYKAQELILKADQQRYSKEVEAISKHKDEETRLENILKSDLKMMSLLAKNLEAMTDPKKIKIAQIQLNAYGVSYKNIKNQLDALKKRTPKRPAPINASIQTPSPRGQKANRPASTPTLDTHGFSYGEATLLHQIRDGEGSTAKKAKAHGYKSGYDVTLGYGKFADDKTKPITEMTIKEIYAHQKKMKKHKKNRFSTGRRDKKGRMIKLPSSAVGAYQIIEPTLRGLVKKLGIDENEKFDAKMQDRLGLELVREAGGNKFRTGKMTAKTFQNRLANKWASIATTKGKSAYAQHTGTSTTAIQTAMSAFKSKETKAPEPKVIIQKGDNRDLLKQLVKNTTPRPTKVEKPKRDISINHDIGQSSV